MPNATKTKETIFACNNQIIDLQTIESKNIDTLNSKLYFCGILLTGGIESSKPHNKYFFGELDSKDSNIGLDISKPIYHFIPKDSSDFIESAKDSKQRDSTYKQDSINFAESNSDSNKLQCRFHANSRIHKSFHRFQTSRFCQ